MKLRALISILLMIGLVFAADPVIVNVDNVPAQTPIEAGNNNVTIRFNASDADGQENLNDSTARALLSRNGINRTSVPCLNSLINATTKEYLCNVSLTYYDPPGDWTINVSVNDSQSGAAHNDTTSFIYNYLKSISLSHQTFDFGNITKGSTASANNNPLQIDNKGNYNFTEINITGYDLLNDTNHIGVGNFTINTTDAIGQRLVNGTNITITNAFLEPDTTLGDRNTSLFLWASVPDVLLGIYTSENNWKISLN